MSRYMNSRLEAMGAYTPGEQPRDKAYIKLNTNESPYPPAPPVVEAMTGELVADLRLYCDPTGKVLKEKLAGLYGVRPEQVFLSNGSDDILNFAFLAFGEQGVCFPDISYGFYGVFSQLHGLSWEQIPLEPDFSIDHRKYCGKGNMVVIANPNAPTGLSLAVAQIEEIVKTNPDSVVVIDEAYVDFGGESCLSLIGRYPNLLVVRTFSKSRCLAGGRLGYAFGDPALIADLEKIKYSTNPYSVNSMTLRLGEATVDAEEYYQKKCREIMASREFTTKELEKLGFRVLPSKTNFVFAETQRMDGEELYLQLKDRGFLVRHFSNGRIRNFNRITIGTREQMERFVETVKDILGGRP